ncbi:S-layer homology domain-containing protein [Bacillus sp. ISL-41]|uniref:S-layer homology domain-containing protein n=1 Tax=Bacillus sp. ISL-41 TaxID=2819127 RepID=UPI001BEBC01C|nr:S-layer homology domain-containing protein [Bacillus sp. ISL-41]MBT2641712.1 S-layer homology domain-containing protein [Bacillus sp. ISL-41]
MKRALLIFALLLSVSGMTPAYAIGNSTVAAANTVVSFSDLKGHWAQHEIESLVSTGAIGGYADGTFRPQETVTRAQFSKILAGVMEVQSNNLAFSNMKGHWAAPFVNGLEDKGVIIPTDYPSGYNPNEVITRLEMSKMIARGLASENESWNSALTGLKNLDYIKVSFTDKHKLIKRDMPLIALVDSSGIVRGRADGSYDPSGRATRAEAAVMLSRFLNAKGKNFDTSQLVNQYKGAKPIHEYTREELEKWVDKDADLKRLSNYPVKHELFPTLAESHDWMMHIGSPYVDKTQSYTKYYLNVAKGFMATYNNRNYKTIGDAWKKEVRYYFRGYEYNGVFYSVDESAQLVNKLVQDTKNNQIISESFFVTDVSMMHNALHESGYNLPRVRGTEYIRFTSGVKLPKGVVLNKWYKRDVDVQHYQPLTSNRVPYETANDPIEGIFPITSYAELKK